MAIEEIQEIFIDENDVPYEEELLRNPYSVKHWMRYIEHCKDGPLEKQNILYERALLQIPGSYKLWYQYLRVSKMKNEPILHPTYENTNNTFERALVFMHKMPRIWIMYLNFLVTQQKITRTRRTFDRALCALPITQHPRIWPLYLEFVMSVDIPETAVRVWRRYLKLCPEDTEDFIKYLLSIGRLDEAAKKYEWCVNCESFQSKYGKSRHQLWSELCELLSKNPQETSLENAEAIIRHSIQKFQAQVGIMWCSLAQHYIVSSLFERARDVFEEGLRSVQTVRDFTQVYNAYTQFEDAMLMKQDSDDILSQDLRLARYEYLLDKRELLLNSVMLKQNPHNVVLWRKRVSLYEGNTNMIVATYTEAVAKIDPKQSGGKLNELWVEFAQFFEKNNQLVDARIVFEKATKVQYVDVKNLANVWCEWVEMEIRHGNKDGAMQLIKRATAAPPRQVDYYDESETVQRRLYKSLQLWRLCLDLEESCGNFKTTKAVYDRIIDLRIATPRIIIQYTMFLEEHNYFEESFRAYEKGIALFNWPGVYDLWTTYLTKFLNRYKGTKLERARDLFEQCLEKCQPEFYTKIYLLYAKMEEEYGLARHAMQIYSRATKCVPAEEKLQVYNIYLKHAQQTYGVTKTRSIYEEAIQDLPNDGAREMCIRFAELECKMGEIDRAREIYIYCSQLSDPRLTHNFWSQWADFEVAHGNENTMKELLRIKRSMQAKYNTQVNMMSAQMLQSVNSGAGTVADLAPGSEDSMRLLEAKAAAASIDNSKIMFVRSSTNSRENEIADEARQANPDEIQIDQSDSEDDDGDIPKTSEVPEELFEGLKK